MDSIHVISLPICWFTLNTTKRLPLTTFVIVQPGKKLETGVRKDGWHNEYQGISNYRELRKVYKLEKNVLKTLIRASRSLPGSISTLRVPLNQSALILLTLHVLSL